MRFPRFHRRCQLFRLVLVLLAASVSSPVLASPVPQVLTVEPNHSTVGFEIPITGGITRVTGKFTRFDITLEAPGDDVSGWSVEATIESASIDTGIDDRDAHLRSETFFDADRHPEIRFQSRRVESRGEGAYVAHGELTMRGVTRSFALPFEITAVVRGDDGSTLRMVGFAARAPLDRHEFGVGSEFQHTVVKNFLGDEVTVEIYCYLRAKAKPAEETR